MKSAFAYPFQAQAPLDPLTATEAVNFIAEVPTSDPFSASAYVFSNGSPTGPAIQAAWQRLFEWLNEERLIGMVQATDGSWRRLSLDWVRSFRHAQTVWHRQPGDDHPDHSNRGLIERSELTIYGLCETVVDARNAAVEGLPWFVERGQLARLIHRGFQARPSHEDLVAWSSEYISSGRGNGMDAAWQAFSNEPKFKGLNRDNAFRPAWRDAKRQ